MEPIDEAIKSASYSHKLKKDALQEWRGRIDLKVGLCVEAW